MSDKKFSSIKLFKERLAREGRLDDYQRRFEELRDAHPLYTGDHWDRMAACRYASSICRDEFGFLGKGEYAASQNYRDMLYLDQQAQKTARYQKTYRANKKMEKYNDAFSSLPMTAEPSKELDWVAAHPAMGRLSRGEVDEESRKVVLKHTDIAKAPSQRAANQLQQWVNDPKEFFKAINSEHKKDRTSVADENSNAEGMDDLSELRQMITSLDNAE